MIESKLVSFNGFLLDGSEPIHPLLLEYLSRKGAKVTQKNGFVIITGDYAIPHTFAMLAELKALSMELHKDVIYDLEVKINNRGYTDFKVIAKKPRTKPTAHEYALILELMVEYFESIGASARLDYWNQIHVIHNDPQFDQKLHAEEMKKYVKNELFNFVDITYTGDFDLPKITYTYDSKVNKPKNKPGM